MKELGLVILVLVFFAAGLFVGLYLADHSPDELVELVEEKIQTGTSTTVTFADENLEAAIRKALGKLPDESITSVELARLTALDASRRDITDLSGIEYCTNLSWLDLKLNQISELSPLSSLTSLTMLHLRGNQISNVSPLTSLTNLAYLYLDHNQIEDLSPLIENDGLGKGDRLSLEDNKLDLSEGSKQLENVSQLEERGVTVHHD